jgi:hypothetical protein
MGYAGYGRSPQTANTPSEPELICKARIPAGRSIVLGNSGQHNAYFPSEMNPSRIVPVAPDGGCCAASALATPT